MKRIFVFLTLLFLVSCDGPTYKEKSSNNWYSEGNQVKEIFCGIYYTVVIIDSCEYIMGRDNGGYNGGFFLAHKGNCKFCEQKLEKKLKSIVYEKK